MVRAVLHEWERKRLEGIERCLQADSRLAQLFDGSPRQTDPRSVSRQTRAICVLLACGVLILLGQLTQEWQLTLAKASTIVVLLWFCLDVTIGGGASLVRRAGRALRDYAAS
jgi:Protein of unknown function (DUF3040)